MNVEKEKFKEQISLYLIQLMEKIKKEKGEYSPEYKALLYQYCTIEQKNRLGKERNLKHYEASVTGKEEQTDFIERLYKRQAVIDITLICSSHCRYCLRQNYNLRQFTFKDIPNVVKYCREDDSLKEVLITGGDPLMVPKLLEKLIEELISKAPNIRIIRIGTRLPVQDPYKMDENLYEFFEKNRDKVKFEIGIQINHVVELQQEACDIIRKLQRVGVCIYSQNVLLKDINDNIDSLVNLYDKLRYLNIEAHYLFHAIPMNGTGRFRTTVEKGIDLIKQLTSSGEISGRIKPMYSLMTDIGKVTLYENTLGEKDSSGYYDVYTKYTLESRRKWNPNYILPESARIDLDGTIIVKYLDGGESTDNG